MHYRDTLIVSPDASFKSILVWLRFATILSQVWKFGCTRLVGRPLCESMVKFVVWSRSCLNFGDFRVLQTAPIRNQKLWTHLISRG